MFTPFSANQTKLFSLITIIVIAVVAIVIWVLSARTTQQEPAPSQSNQPPSAPVVTPALPDIPDQTSLIGTVTYIQDNSLTVMVFKSENPVLTNDRALIVALHQGTQIKNNTGKSLTASQINIGDKISVSSENPFSLNESVVPADEVIVNP